MSLPSLSFDALPCVGDDVLWQVGLLAKMTGSLVLVNSAVSGSVPTQLGRLTELAGSLDLGSTSISGSVPTQLGRLTELAGNLYLGTTSISGSVPKQLGRLTALAGALELGGTSISGSVPTQLGRLTALAGSLYLYTTSISGSVPTQLGRLTALLGSLYLDTTSISGSVPTQLGNLGSLRTLNLGSMRLQYPSTPSQHLALRTATRRCGGAPTVCLGVPPASCSAFGPTYAPVIGETSVCVECGDAAWLVGLVLALLALLLVGAVAGFVRALHRHPRGLKRWVSTCAILASHVQGLAILGSLPLEWPLALRQMLAAVGLDALRIPSVSCLFRSGGEGAYGIAAAGGSPQGWTYPLIVCGGAVAILVGLFALAVVHRRRGNPEAADSAELALSIAFTLPLVTVWRSLVTLAQLVAAVPSSRDALVRMVATGDYNTAYFEAAVQSAADRLEALWAGGLTVMCLLLALQLCLALRFARLVNTFRRCNRQLANDGHWPKDALPPRRLHRR